MLVVRRYWELDRVKETSLIEMVHQKYIYHSQRICTSNNELQNFYFSMFSAPF